MRERRAAVDPGYSKEDLDRILSLNVLLEDGSRVPLHDAIRNRRPDTTYRSRLRKTVDIWPTAGAPFTTPAPPALLAPSNPRLAAGSARRGGRTLVGAPTVPSSLPAPLTRIPSPLPALSRLAVAADGTPVHF